ncbi:MAG: hypothetical protein ACK5WR_09445, partial [Planctomycetaceae bacterium]
MNSLSEQTPSAPALSFRGPYPGLRPFEEADAPRFFGRGAQSGQMLRRLEDHQFLAVIGSSGCGKSSLVYAGLLPALRQGWLLGALPHWKMLKLRPGEAPLDNLAAALYGEFQTPADPSSETYNPPVDGKAELGTALLRNTLSRGRYGLLDALRDAGLDDQTNVLVLVDQFEELFRYREKIDAVDPAERERIRYQRHSEATEFVDLLLAAARQTHVPEEQRLPVYVVITMRSDFLGNCDLFQGLPEAINDSQFLTPRMTRDQLRDAIVEPLSVFNAQADPTLVGRILDDLGAESDQLPLMQHALMRTWNIACQPLEVWRTRPLRLTLDDYLHSTVGGVAHALDNHANEIYAGLQGEPTRGDLTVASHEPTRPSPLPPVSQLLEWGLRRFGTSTAELRGRLERWLTATPSTASAVSSQPAQVASPDVASPEAASPEVTSPEVTPSSPASSSTVLTRDAPFENLLRRVFRPVLREWGIGVPPPPNSAQWLCERMFRCLSAYNSTGQLVRRLATVREIAQVAGVTDARGEPDVERVLAVARPFLAEGCSLLRASPDAQTQPLDGETTLDISHEALLRQWTRCREWVEAERESERTWRRVLDEATLWRQGRAGYFPGASLVPIEEWRGREQPTEAWANRYPADDGKPRVSFQDAEIFLRRSRTSANVFAALPYLMLLSIFLAGAWFSWFRNREQQKRFVDRQVALLEGAEVNQIQKIVDQPELREVQQQVFERLWEDFQTTSDVEVQHNCALALLSLNGLNPTPKTLPKVQEAREHLVNALLSAGPDEILGWRSFLKPFAREVAPALWEEVRQTSNRVNRLRAAAALAAFDPTPEYRQAWEDVGNDLAQELIAVSALEFKAWSENLKPVRQYLLPHLEKIYFGLRNEQRRSLTEAAVLVLADHWRDDPQRLVTWLSNADTVDEFQPFVTALAALKDEATALLVSRAGGPSFAEQSINPTAQQQTEVDWKSRWREPLNASVCLVQLDQLERIRPLWLPAAKGTGPEQVVDPTFQSYLIARFQELGAIDPEALMKDVEKLNVGTGDTAYDNNTIRQALLLVMGDFDSVRLPVAVRSNLKTKLETLYRSTPDSGVRAAAGWVWQQWQRQN